MEEVWIDVVARKEKCRGKSDGDRQQGSTERSFNHIESQFITSVSEHLHIPY